MSTFPDALFKRLQNTVATTKRRVENAHQRLNTIGSQVNSLQPGDWNLLELNSGWSSISGYIPAQSRLEKQGVSWLVGHIEGGTVSDGTVIGAVAAGHFNPTQSHSFTANVLAGAGATATTGTISGSTDSNALSNGGVSGATTSNALSDGSTTGTSDATTATSGVSHTHGAGSYSVDNSFHTHSASSMSVINSFHTHTNTSAGQAASTNVNYNTAILTIDPSGNVTLSNCPAEATQISFSEYLPLSTS